MPFNSLNFWLVFPFIFGLTHAPLSIRVLSILWPIATTWIDYVKASAERLKTMCGYGDFDSRNFTLRKVLLKSGPKVRPTTNVGKRRNAQIDRGADPIELWQQVFPLRKVCECRQR